MRLEQISNIAEDTVEMLRKYCKRIEIAGSIRRQKASPKDIEIVCIADGCRLEKAFVDMKFSTNIQFTKNGVKYKRFLWSGVWHDLFITDEDNWGLIYMIRTGPKDYNIRLVNALKKRGYTMEDGRLYKEEKNNQLVIKTEQDIFDILNCRFIEPKNRK